MKWIRIILAALIGYFSAAVPMMAQTQNTEVTIRVFNRSHVSPSILLDGEKQASEVISEAGIHVAWLNCRAGTQACIEQPSSRNLILTILKQGSAIGSDDVLGLAAQNEVGSGAYCYVFENKLNEISGENHVAISRLLRYAPAHEIGHLLKGSHSHSRDGVMSGLWSPSLLEQISRGALGFTQEDAEIMQARLRNLINTNETVSVVMEKVPPRP